MEPLGLLYKAIVDRIRETGLPVNWVDIDLGQIDKDAEVIPIEFPAILLKFGDVIWQDTADTQLGIVNVGVKFVFKFTSEEDNLTAIKTRDEAVAFLALMADVDIALSEIRGEAFTRLLRYNQYTLKTKPEYFHWVHVIEYQCNVQRDGLVIDNDVVTINYEFIRDSNDYMERRKFDLIHK